MYSAKGTLEDKIPALRLLLSYKPNVNIVNYDGQSPLVTAVSRKNEKNKGHVIQSLVRLSNTRNLFETIIVVFFV